MVYLGRTENMVKNNGTKKVHLAHIFIIIPHLRQFSYGNKIRLLSTWKRSSKQQKSFARKWIFEETVKSQ